MSLGILKMSDQWRRLATVVGSGSIHSEPTTQQYRYLAQLEAVRAERRAPLLITRPNMLSEI
jgi:hypothetical protein